ncbi:MAG: TolC family protein, partial [Chitinophagales bacterium]
LPAQPAATTPAGAATAGAPAVPGLDGLTLAEAARLALQGGPQQVDLRLAADRAQAGLDLAESPFRLHVTVGTAKIPQIMELANQFSGALGGMQYQLSQITNQPGSPPEPSSPGTTGLVYDATDGHRWAVLPAISAAETLPTGGQLVLSTNWGLFGPLDGDGGNEAKWQPFRQMPLVQFTQPLGRPASTLEPVMAREEAARNVSRTRAAATLTETKTLLDLAEAYFAVARGQDEVEAASRAVSQAQTEARIRQDKAWKNDATGLDLMEADVAAQRAAARLEAARHNLDLARQRLNRALGRPFTAPVAVRPPEGPPAQAATPAGAAPVSNLAAATADALGRRAELALAQSKVESARAQLAAARESARTQISASGAVAADKSWRIGVDVQVPVYDGGTSQALVAQAEAALAQAVKELADRRDDVTLQVSQAFFGRQDAARAFEVADLAARRATQALSAARDRLAQGAAIAREVTAAEDALFEAESARRSALYRWHQAEWAWLAALGRLTPETATGGR